MSALKDKKAKPRRLDDEMPPVSPTAIYLGHSPGGSMVDCRIEGFGTGIYAESIDDLIIKNLTVRRTRRPIVVKRGKRIRANGLDFQT